jgi:DNA-binding response OmpR family regulator
MMRKVLIVEDELDLCQLMAIHLNNLSIENDFVHKVSSAKNKIQEVKYDMVLLDLHLEDGSGFELAAWLNVNHPAVKIIVLSGYDAERKEAAALGVDLFLSKPFTKSALQLVIENC